MRLRQTAFLAVFSFLFSGFLFAGPPTITPSGRSVPGEVLVKFQTGTTDDEVAAAGHGADVDHSQRVASVKAGTIWRLHSKSLKTDALATALQHNPKVVYAEPNYVVNMGSSPNDTSYTSLWGLNNTGQLIAGTYGSAGADIRAEAAWAVTTGSASVVVGVVDTGIDYAHPDLAANVWSNPGGKGNANCAAGTHGFNALTGTCDPMDDNYHGTHVSGTIGAVGNNSLGVVGVNWTTSIMGLKFLDYTGSGTTANAITAIDFAVQAKIDGVNVRVLSNSWGGVAFSKALLDEINKAGENDILFVASAGNDSVNNDVYPHYPSSYGTPNLISVAATDNRDALAYFSNYGPTTVHLGAPGLSVLSCAPGGGYQYLSGTSMAAPHVSGVAALVLANSPSLTTAQVKSAILDHVDPLPSLKDLTTTGGRLNAARAIGAPVPPSFTVSATPSTRTVARGASTTYTISIVPSDGFNAAVSLSASSLPTGVTAGFSPTSTTSSSTLTLTADQTATIGTYTILVTGTSGSLTRSTTISLTTALVTPPTPCGTLTGSVYALNFTPYAVANGDLNRDGIADAVLVSPSNKVMVMMGYGNGAFQPASNLNASGTPLGLALADFNRDGKLDLVLATSASSSVTVRLGNGDGTFQSPIDYAAGASPFWVATGDFNGDGKTDIAIANNGSANISILRGNGDGTFAAPINSAAASGPYWVSIADFNGDGKSDLAVANFNANKVSILLGAGDGTFQSAVHYTVGTRPSSIAVGDFNRDGKPDLAVANYGSNSISVLIGAGDGTFGAAVPYATDAGPSSVVVFDVNGDNQPDLAVANTDGASIGILRGAGDGTFLLQTLLTTGYSTPSQLAVADVDRDGRPDLVVADSYYARLIVFRNTGSCSQNCGVMSATAGATSGSTPQSIATGDFNRDGKVDLAIANGGSNSVSIALGNGDGTFPSSAGYSAGNSPQAVSAADLNGDGKLDLIVADDTTNKVGVLLGNFGGTFQGVTVYGAGTSPDSIAVGDFNGDGKLDVAAANSGSNNVSVLLGNGDGTLQSAVSYAAGTTPSFVVAGDFDRDGKIDLVVANSGSNNVSILLGNGDGTFQTATSISVGTTPKAIAVADFNRDGRLDLAVTNSGSNNISILLGSASGVFAAAVNYGAGGTSPKGVTAADFNNDGIADIAVAVSGANQAPILFNAGDGTFGTAVLNGAGTAPAALAAADFDRDGHLDLAVANSGSSNVSILLDTCPLADLTVAVIHNGTFAQGDSGKTYTITVTNSGAAATSGTVSVTDTLPAGLIATAMSGSGWTCTLNTRTCTRADALAGVTSYPAITLTVNVANNAPTTVTNNVAVSGGGELNTANDSASDLATVAAITDLTVTLTHSGSFTQGATGRTYTIAVRNAGRSATSGQITVVDSLPSGLTATAMSGTGWTCSAGSLTCTRSDSLAGSSTAPLITLTVNVAANAGVSIVNSATVSGGGEANTANDTSQDPTTIWSHQSCGGLTAAVGYPAGGYYPYALAKGDFNHDGISDFAVSNGNNPSFSIILGVSGGTFAAPVTYSLANYINNIVLGDLNGDGNIDVVASSNNGGSFFVVLGNGDGTFGTPTSYSPGSFPTSITLGDFNGDGNIDVAVASDSGYIYILIGNGNGTLQPPLALHPGGYLLGLNNGDLNGDGNADLVAVDYYNYKLLILKGNGDGTFQTAVSYDSGYSPNTVVLTDLNGDRKLDVVVGRNYANVVTTFLGSGDGTVVKSADSSVYGANSVAVEDLNGDGNVDIVALSGYGYLSTLLGNGDGTFQPSSNTYTNAYSPGQLAIGDFNADGRADIAFADDSYPGRIMVMTGGCPDLTVTKTHTGVFVAGSSNFYNVTVKNLGASTTAPITVTDILPNGMSITNMYGYPGTCDVANGRCTLDSGLQAGQSVAIQVTVNVSKTAPSSVVNQATVTGGGDVNLLNNTASDPTSIVYYPDLTVTMTHDGTFVAGQTGRNYTLTVANAGSAPTNGTVTAIAYMPAGLTATAIAGQGWNCSPSLICTRNDVLEVNSAYPPITLTVNVSPSLMTNVTSSVTVSGGGETYTYNDSAYDPTPVLYAPNGIVATGILTSQVNVSWTPVSGATAYQVLRSSDNITFNLVGTTLQSQLSFLDTSLAPNSAYFYRVRGIDPTATGPLSVSDVALTFIFTNDPIVPGSTPILPSDVMELRSAANILRAAAGLSAATFTDASLSGQPIKAIHFNEIQTAIDQARAARSLPAVNYISVPGPGTPVYGLYVTLLRSGLK